MNTTDPRPWASFFANYPGTTNGLAASLRCTRGTLHYLKTGEHLRCPVLLLGRFANVLRAAGMADGSDAPDRSELVRAWRQEFELATQLAQPYGPRTRVLPPGASRAASSAAASRATFHSPSVARHFSPMRPSYWKDCTERCEAVADCVVCGLRKKPVGRDSRDNSLCDQDCPGYSQPPSPGHLWPGELADMDREP